MNRTFPYARLYWSEVAYYFDTAGIQWYWTGVGWSTCAGRAKALDNPDDVSSASESCGRRVSTVPGMVISVLVGTALIRFSPRRS